MKKIKENDNIEELIVLLSSLHIRNIKKYLIKHNYLLNLDIYDVAYIISKTFNEKYDYCKTKRLLTKTKYDIIDKKGD